MSQRYRLKDHCPKCGSKDLERVPRTFFARYILFFLDIKTYWCRKCFSRINCVVKED